MIKNGAQRANNNVTINVNANIKDQGDMDLLTRKIDQSLARSLKGI